MPALIARLGQVGPGGRDGASIPPQKYGRCAGPVFAPFKNGRRWDQTTLIVPRRKEIRCRFVILARKDDLTPDYPTLSP